MKSFTETFGLPATMRTVSAFCIAVGVAALGVFGAAVLSGCGASTHSNAPEPTSSSIIDGTNTAVIRMPDGFRNVAFTCFGKQGVYVTSRGAATGGSSDGGNPQASSIFVVTNDPRCP
jgi:hypothetical protein